jgi:hypothetical protein
MTVLGNIVAVTSIIAVVSLIQGLNASVKAAILNQAGADSFNIQQFPITRSDEEFEKVRANPRISVLDARAIRRYSTLATAVMLDSSSAGRIVYRDKSIDSTRIQGVTGDYVNFSSFDAERGRLMSPTEVDTSRPVVVLGWQTADTLFGASTDPIDKVIQVEGHHFRVVGVSAKRGSFLGQSQDEFVVVPLGQFQMLFGSRRPLSMTVKPRDMSQISQAIDEATLALRMSRRLKPKQPDNFGIFTSDTILARRRRHRHHEHHAHGGHGADARDRPSQGARRTPVRHHDADSHRVDRPLDIRRHRRHAAGRRDRPHDLGVHADSGVGRAVERRARHRHHGGRRPVLRPLPGDARGAPRSDRSPEARVAMITPSSRAER